jgi:hypothetical protein
MTTRPIFTERGTFSEALRVPVNDACAVIPLEDRGITENATEDSERDLQVYISPRGVWYKFRRIPRVPLTTCVLSTYGLMLMRARTPTEDLSENVLFHGKHQKE